MNYPKIFYWLILFGVMGFSCPTKAAEKIVSPNGKTAVIVDVNAGHLTYQVTLNDVVFIEPSALGLKTNVDDLIDNATPQRYVNELAPFSRQLASMLRAMQGVLRKAIDQASAVQKLSAGF